MAEKELRPKKGIKVMDTLEIKKDGTLLVHVEEGAQIKRVMVIGDDHNGDIFYPDKD